MLVGWVWADVGRHGAWVGVGGKVWVWVSMGLDTR